MPHEGEEPDPPGPAGNRRGSVGPPEPPWQNSNAEPKEPDEDERSAGPVPRPRRLPNDRRGASAEASPGSGGKHPVLRLLRRVQPSLQENGQFGRPHRTNEERAAGDD